MPGFLVTLRERDRWASALDGLAHGFTHTWGHCRAISLTTGVDAVLWCGDDGPDRVVCPLMERPFDEFRDLATPPGVSGFAGAGDAARLRSSWEHFTRAGDYVSGYVGLNPFFVPAPWQNCGEAYNTLFALDLRRSREDLLHRMDQNRRRELREYETLGSRITTDRERLTRHLLATYAGFAEHSLPPSLRWTGATLQAYCETPQVLLLGMEGPEGIEAVHLYGHTAHGADLLLLAPGPQGRRYTAVLIWHAVHLLSDLGVPLLNLGGGAHAEDPISRAKQRFGAERYPLTSLREIYDPATYALLCRRAGVDPDAPGHFPAYRRAAPGSA